VPIAGVEPRFVQLNGRDASALIVSANIARGIYRKRSRPLR
jgi:hypothetical protein